MRSRRVNRLETPSVEITFRGEVTLAPETVWREDRLLFVASDEVYLVLDFGLEEVLVHGGEAAIAAEGDMPEAWQLTGALSVEVQRIDPDTGAGLARTVHKQIAEEGGAPIAWSGWALIPCSPRRRQPTDEVIAPDMRGLDLDGIPCVVCGDPAVHVDAEGSPLCAAHVGESPEERKCRVCGCTDDDCSGCIARTGQPCSWAEPDLCTACVAKCRHCDEPATGVGASTGLCDRHSFPEGRPPTDPG